MRSCVFNVICPYKIVVVVSDKISYQKCMFLASVIFDSKLVRLEVIRAHVACCVGVCRFQFQIGAIRSLHQRKYQQEIS